MKRHENDPILVKLGNKISSSYSAIVQTVATYKCTRSFRNISFYTASNLTLIINLSGSVWYL